MCLTLNLGRPVSLGRKTPTDNPYMYMYTCICRRRLCGLAIPGRVCVVSCRARSMLLTRRQAWSLLMSPTAVQVRSRPSVWERTGSGLVFGNEPVQAWCLGM